MKGVVSAAAGSSTTALAAMASSAAGTALAGVTPSRVQNTAPMTATPLATPNCWAVVRIPAAAPARSGGTCDSAAPISDGSAMPWPRPMIAVAGARSQPVRCPP